MVNDATSATAGTAGRLVSGRYRLQEPIGRGAMGIVWRGRDELLDREVAVKEVRAAMTTAAESQDIYRRTLREAKAAARLNHPGVVTVFDVVEEDGSPWIVMELVHARSLDRVIAEDGPLQPLQAARVGERLLSALACAHAAGVLHRDVKPGNVLIGTDDAVVRHCHASGRSRADPGRDGSRDARVHRARADPGSLRDPRI
jgi:serine/threonine protein kinase